MSEKHITDFEKSLALRLKALRNENGLTLDELAKKSGVSKATLHRIEKCDVSPTTSVLGKLCASYNLPLSFLMMQAEKKVRPLISREEQSVWVDPSTGYKRTSVSPPSEYLGCEVVECELPAHTFMSSEKAPVLNLEHHVYLLNGELEITIGSDVYQLSEGDCLRYKLSGSHAFKVLSAYPAIFIMVIL